MSVKEYVTQTTKKKEMPDLSKHPKLDQNSALREIAYREREYAFLLHSIENWSDHGDAQLFKQDAYRVIGMIRWRDARSGEPTEEGWGWHNHSVTRERFMRFYYSLPALIEYAVYHLECALMGDPLPEDLKEYLPIQYEDEYF